ncbi:MULTISPECIES: hypothetical protein [unclassified Thalassospira]|jgi:hypothetical protein|uniref:hypothetical protein n=1 Tax=Thalassospira TaxID=168934 RepID=UPI002024610B|nr:hypothetical protein [Thalassospira sp. GO-4]URK18526.1 hypothetical protein M9H61_03180 [Thalassospira sp. GO-4]|eukprot:NODE_2420_length_1069_cov_1.264331_g2402_i0.p1 GENE.NODE_2420_length_1069_cov_1.264331_g2402_i0~~NODE_2420_length_1069_cov_1.264331_g2402_i0.p1  ORF type:complete len:213 (+),score=15.01 NODE_2420_length_1069_cov_1.264331_g2402_i0:228-866(+)
MAIRPRNHIEAEPVDAPEAAPNVDPVKPAGVGDSDVQMMSYPPKLMAPDLAKSIVGLLICGVIALIPDMLEIIQWTAAGLALLFVFYFARTLIRFQSKLFVSEYGIRLSSLRGGTAFAWPELSKFRLRYFSTKRDGNKGWFELTLHAGETKIVAESTLDGFDDLLEISRDWAKDNQLLVDDVTRTNLMRMDEAETLVQAAAAERTNGGAKRT